MEIEKKCVTIANTVGVHMSQEGVQWMARVVQGLGSDGKGTVHSMQYDNEEAELSTQEFDVGR